jgi:hypothetical protein
VTAPARPVLWITHRDDERCAGCGERLARVPTEQCAAADARRAFDDAARTLRLAEGAIVRESGRRS